MIVFWLKVDVNRHREGDDKDYKYKKISWPVLPRVDEWIHLEEDLAYPVISVRHWTKAGQSRIEVEVSFSVFEFERDLLTEENGWLDRPR